MKSFFSLTSSLNISQTLAGIPINSMKTKLITDPHCLTLDRAVNCPDDYHIERRETLNQRPCLRSTYKPWRMFTLFLRMFVLWCTIHFIGRLWSKQTIFWSSLMSFCCLLLMEYSYSSNDGNIPTPFDLLRGFSFPHVFVDYRYTVTSDAY